MSTFEDFRQALLADRDLAERFEAERKRIIDAGEAADDASLLAQAAEAVGFTLTQTDIERLYADEQELSDDELDWVSGGGDDEMFAPAEEDHHLPMMDVDAWCVALDCCYTALMHDTDYVKDAYGQDVAACWKTYKCVFINR